MVLYLRGRKKCIVSTRCSTGLARLTCSEGRTDETDAQTRLEVVCRRIPSLGQRVGERLLREELRLETYGPDRDLIGEVSAVSYSGGLFASGSQVTPKKPNSHRSITHAQEHCREENDRTASEQPVER